MSCDAQLLFEVDSFHAESNALDPFQMPTKNQNSQYRQPGFLAKVNALCTIDISQIP